MITAIVLSRNEEVKIEKCLKSLSWCGEIIIVDDYSTDKTLKIAQKYTKKVYQRKIDGNFASQRNFALDKASNDWVLFIDADEWVSEELRKEIKKRVTESVADNVNGFYVKRKDYFLGRWLSYGETANIELLRLAKKGSGRWVGKAHEVWNITGNVSKLSKPIYHYSHNSVTEFLLQINIYSGIVAKERIRNGIRAGLFEIITYPLGKFIQNYFIKLGFLDGTPGLIMAIIMSFHSFLVRTKMYFLK